MHIEKLGLKLRSRVITDEDISNVPSLFLVKIYIALDIINNK